MASKNYKCLHTQFFPSHSRPIFTLPLCFIPSLLFPSPFLPLVQPSCPSSSSSSEARVPRVRMTNNEGKKKTNSGPIYTLPLDSSSCSCPLCRAPGLPPAPLEPPVPARVPRGRGRSGQGTEEAAEGGRPSDVPTLLGPSPPGLFPMGPPRTPKGAQERESAWFPSPWKAQVAASGGNSKRRASVLECFDKRQGSRRGLTCT